MKAKNLIRALNKAGIELTTPRGEKNPNFLRGELNGKVIEFHIQGESAICVRCRYEWDKDDMQSDYSAGSFQRTIKNAVAYMTRIEAAV